MTCDECEKAFDEGVYFPYRWKHATVAIIACKEHAKEMLDYLNKRFEK